MVYVQEKNEDQFYPQPISLRLRQDVIPPAFEQNNDSKYKVENGRGPRNSNPQALCHYGKFPAQNIPYRFVLFICFGIINEQPWRVKQTGKPRNDEDYMKCFQIEVHVFVKSEK